MIRGGGGNPPFPRVLYETLICVIVKSTYCVNYYEFVNQLTVSYL